MKKILQLLVLSFVALVIPVAAQADPARKPRAKKPVQTLSVKNDNSASVYNSVSKEYASGHISADSVVSIAMYHKTGNVALAERCLKLVADKSPRAEIELGALYAFTPEFSKHVSEGLKLLQKAAASGQNGANCYLGLYYFNHKDYKQAKAYFDACRPMDYGIGYTALGSMYTSGMGVPEDLPKAREYYHKAALKGYPRGMALYGFNLRASAGGAIDLPDSFFWLYMAGDLGDDAARATLSLPLLGEKRGESEAERDAVTSLYLIQMANAGKIQNQPIYREGFLRGLSAREKAAEQGDDWSRFYLGSMNYNGDFLNQNYARALYYYEPIVLNGQLPPAVLAVVHERLAKIYAEGKATKADPAKALHHTRQAAHYGSPTAYRTLNP